MNASQTVTDDARIRAAAERLRAAKQVEEEEREQEGFERGRDWALESAIPSELEAVASLENTLWLSYQPKEGDTLVGELNDIGIRQLHAEDPFSCGFVRGAGEASDAVNAAEGGRDG